MRKAVAFLMAASLAAPSPAREWRELQGYAFSLIRSLYHARERGGMRSSLDQYWRFERGRMGRQQSPFGSAHNCACPCGLSA